MLAGTFVRCAVNPTVHKQDLLAATKAGQVKNVAIIGGGPAGMEAALVCDKRGHNVTLYEKRELGGVLIEASAPDFKADIRDLIKYYKAQLKKSQVKVVKEEATVETIKKGKFDAAIVAVGAAQRKVDAHGIDKPIVIPNALDVLNGKAKVGQRVIVVGGGLTGVETALFLAEQDKEVTIISRRDDFMEGLGHNRPAYMMRLGARKVKSYNGKLLYEVLDNAAVFVDRYGARLELPADSIVIVSGFVPQAGLRRQLEDETELDVYAAGDCVSVGMILEAVRDGYRVANRI
jgi:thioredoxin reductase